MRLIFMGSAAFAVPSLEALLKSRHEILAVVTQPDKPVGRGLEIKPCAVAAAAKEKGLNLFQPKSVKDLETIDHLRTLAPHIIIVVAYGKILPKDLLEIPHYGCINLHASLLPKYRGAAPINWAIVKGEKETGVSTQRIVEELDAGDVLLSEKTLIGNEETAADLYERLSQMGSELLLETIDSMELGLINPVPQDNRAATYAPIIRKEDGIINWRKNAADIFNQIRGFTPWPGAFTKLDGKMFRIHKATASPAKICGAAGEIVDAAGKLVVACGSGTLYLEEVQLEGKRKMPIEEFLRGHKLQTGTCLGK